MAWSQHIWCLLKPSIGDVDTDQTAIYLNTYASIHTTSLIILCVNGDEGVAHLQGRLPNTTILGLHDFIHRRENITNRGALFIFQAAPIEEAKQAYGLVQLAAIVCTSRYEYRYVLVGEMGISPNSRLQAEAAARILYDQADSNRTLVVKTCAKVPLVTLNDAETLFPTGKTTQLRILIQSFRSRVLCRPRPESAADGSWNLEGNGGWLDDHFTFMKTLYEGKFPGHNIEDILGRYPTYTSKYEEDVGRYWASAEIACLVQTQKTLAERAVLRVLPGVDTFKILATHKKNLLRICVANEVCFGSTGLYFSTDSYLNNNSFLDQKDFFIFKTYITTNMRSFGLLPFPVFAALSVFLRLLQGSLLWTYSYPFDEGDSLSKLYKSL